MIGSTHNDDLNKVFLRVTIKNGTSNQKMQLSSEDKVTNERGYVQIPIPSNFSNAQVGATVIFQSQSEKIWPYFKGLDKPSWLRLRG